MDNYGNGMNNGGYPPQEPQYGAPVPQGGGESKGLAIASMVVGIVSMVTCCCLGYFSALVSIVAIVLGIISIKKQQGGKGMAIAGIVLGSVSLAGILLSLILVATGVVNTDMTQWQEYLEQFQSSQV